MSLKRGCSEDKKREREKENVEIKINQRSVNASILFAL
jgi:hypothetical protein